MLLPDNHPLRVAHEKSANHRAEIESSEKCGCFYCEAIFDADQVADWTDDNMTALCPFCGVDSVIGDSSGFEITKRFLEEMHEVWFDGSTARFRSCAP
jgi:hypothetical protein